MAAEWKYFSWESVGALRFGELISFHGNAYLYEQGAKLCWDLDAIFLQFL